MGELFVGIELQEGVEVAHGKGAALDDADVGDGLPVLVEGLHRGDDVIHVLLAELAAVDCEADHVAHLRLLLRRLQVVLHGVVAQLGGADAVAADELYAEPLAGEGVMAPLAVEELVHVDVQARYSHCFTLSSR